MSAPVLYLRVGRNLRGRDIIVGDIDGCFDQLRAALAAIEFDDSAGDRLFCVGNVFKAGAENDVLWWLSRPWLFAVRGDNEQKCLDGSGPYAAAYVDACARLPLAIALETEDGLIGIVHAECPTPTFVRLEHEFAGRLAEGVAMCCVWSRTRMECHHTDHIEDVRAVVVGYAAVIQWTSMGNHVYINTRARGRSFTLLDAATLRPVKPARNTRKKDAATA